MKLAFNKNNITIIEIPMIKTVRVNFVWPKIQEGIIITSSSALKSIVKHPSYYNLKKHPFFCVGSYTKKRLYELGLNVEECEASSKDLALKIGDKYSKKKFNYFCGKQRLKTIEIFAKKNNIDIKISEVYETIEIRKKIKEKFDGIIFFSPSAVRSYVSLNSLNTQKVFSWGQTTAKEIEKYCDIFFTSKTPSIKSLVSLINKTLEKINA
jgi:uroporphyrinogen-III synthase